MNAGPPKKPKTVLETILDWSQERPLWQRDALRRIVTKGILDADDINALVDLCKQARLDLASPGLAVPLEASHLPATPDSGASVTLSSISGVEGVNQLAQDQTLTFANTGLTVIYGDNGAGKSGYARILKKACRARHTEDVAPDAFASPTEVKPATAKLTHVVGTNAPATIAWSAVAKVDPILSAITVSDSDCATVHLREKNEVFFRPFGLDIPDELARACQLVKEALTREQQELERSRSSVFVTPPWRLTTSVGTALSALTAKSDLVPITKLAEVTDAEIARHTSLVEDLSKDPMKAVAERLAIADSIQRLRTSVQTTSNACDDGVLLGLKALATDARQKRLAASVAADKAFSEAALPGVGGAAWKALWEAAQRYSEQLVGDKSAFPPTAAGGPCPLCHQTLGEDARVRLQSFQQFVEADTERQAVAAESAFGRAEAQFSSRRFSGSTFAADLGQLQLQNAVLAKRVRRLLATSRLRRAQCAKSLVTDDEVKLTGFADNPISDLDALQAQVQAYANELKSAADTAARAKLEAERSELGDRIALRALLPNVSGEIERLKTIAHIAECLKDTSTTAITNLGNAIADDCITPAIRDRFQDEIVRIASNKVRVEVVRSGGKFGSPHYQVRLFANPQAKVHAVLSEGEQTCVALAAFLTELATAGHNSALVFDDPVSSLDHRWRRQVATRLVEEARVRQIIVFTHDLVFVNDIIQDAAEHKVQYKTATVSRGPTGTGIVTDGLPWVAASIEDRLDKLEKEARSARQAYDANDEDTYRDQVHAFYDRLRSTWERAIEQVAFHHVVVRHRDYIETRHLRKATVITDDDCDKFAAAYKTCCDQVPSHDPSSARNAAPPAPPKLLADVAALKDWVKSIRDRQKAVA